MGIEVGTPEEIERYKVDIPIEIERILRGVMEKKALVTVYSENNREFLVTTLIGVDGEGGAIYLGRGPEERSNAALLASREVSYNTSHDHVRVLFTTPPLQETLLDGELVLWAPLPAELLRFQRREFFRLPTSVLNPARCLIALEEGMVEATVADIGIGGIGIVTHDAAVRLRVGAEYHGCRLNLPNAGNYVVNLRVRTLYEQSLRGGGVSRRAGCQFVQLSSSVEADIQRYIMRIERDRRLGAL